MAGTRGEGELLDAHRLSLSERTRGLVNSFAKDGRTWEVEQRGEYADVPGSQRELKKRCISCKARNAEIFSGTRNETGTPE